LACFYITVGDGTTSVILFTGELLKQALVLARRDIHPIVITEHFSEALTIVEEAIYRQYIMQQQQNQQQQGNNEATTTAQANGAENSDKHIHSQQTKEDTTTTSTNSLLQQLLSIAHTCLTTKYLDKVAKVISTLVASAIYHLYEQISVNNHENVVQMGNADTLHVYKLSGSGSSSLEDSVMYKNACLLSARQRSTTQALQQQLSKLNITSKDNDKPQKKSGKNSFTVLFTRASINIGGAASGIKRERKIVSASGFKEMQE